MKERSSLAVHDVILLSAICTYLVEPDDVVWQFIRGASNVRSLEHVCFAIAALILAISLWLRIRVDTQRGDTKSDHGKARHQRIASEFLQAVGIGSLMPLAGFLLLVVGETVLAVFRSGSKSDRPISQATPDPQSGWKELLSRDAGLCFAFLSMVIFSITLSDRLAEYLFAGSALVTILTNLVFSSA